MSVSCSNCEFVSEPDQQYFAGNDCPKCDTGTLQGLGGGGELP